MHTLLSQLIIVARDLGQPVPYETTQPLQVALLDIDDNEPVFLKPPVSAGLIVPGVVGLCVCCGLWSDGVCVCTSAWQLVVPEDDGA